MVAVIAVQEGRYLMSLAPLAVYFFATGLMLTIRWILHVGRSASVPQQLHRVAFAGCVAIALVAIGTALTQAKPIELFAAPGLRSIFDRLAEVNHSSPSRVAFVNPPERLSPPVLRRRLHGVRGRRAQRASALIAA